MRRIATALAAAGVLAALIVPATASAAYGPNGTSWGGSGTANGQFNHPEGAVVDANGRVYVADTGNARVERFNATGGGVTVLSGSGADYAPEDIAIGAGGNIFASSPGRVDEWGLLGLPIRHWTTSFTAYGIAADGSGNVFVSDPQHGLIHVFDATGKETASWGSQGSGPGQMLHPLGLTTDSAGSVYVADPDLGRIDKFSSTGALQGAWGMPAYSGAIQGSVYPRDVAVDSGGRVYAPDAGTQSNLTAVFGAGGALQQLFGSPVTDPTDPCTLSSPWGLATSPSGALYVVSTGENRIRVFDEASTACPAPNFGTAPSGGGGSGGSGGDAGSNPSAATAGASSGNGKPQIQLRGFPRHCTRQNFSFQIHVTADNEIKTLLLFVNGNRAARQMPGQTEWNVKVNMPVKAVRRQLPKGTRVKVTIEVRVRDAAGNKADLKKAFSICG